LAAQLEVLRGTFAGLAGRSLLGAVAPLSRLTSPTGERTASAVR
jgi:hypothetical protein